MNKRESWVMLRERAADPDDDFSEDIPSLSTYYRWISAAEEAGEVSLQALVEEPKPGRPRKQIAKQVEKFIRTKVQRGYQTSVSSICRATERKFGEEAPSEYLIRRYIRELDPAFVSGSRHGSKAAISDSMPKMTIPVDYPHQYWVMDELRMPFYLKAFHSGNGRLVSAKPYAAAVIEAYSRSLISLTLFRPWRNGTEGGYDSDDILATFTSAALPEVALSACRPFTGYLPDELRMDNHATHNLLRGVLKDVGQVTVASLRVGSPWGTGLIEALVGTVKDLAEEMEIHGLATKFLPADRANVDPRRSRANAAATTSERVPRQIMIAVDDLLSFEEAQEQLDHLARAYNTRPHDGLDGRTPEDVYQSSLRRDHQLTPGRDMLYHLEGRSVTMADRLRVKGEKFAPVVNGRMLTKGEELVVKVDPQRRGLWVVEGNDHWFVPTLEEYSRTVQAGDHAREERSKARAISDDAQEELERSVEELLGPGAVDRGRYEAEKLREEKRRKKKQGKQNSKRLKKSSRADEEPGSADEDDQIQPEESENGRRFNIRRPILYSSLKSRIRTN